MVVDTTARHPTKMIERSMRLCLHTKSHATSPASIIQHPDLLNLRRMLLATKDAHSLYAKFGFKPLAAPDRIMEVHNPDVYAYRAR